MLLRQPAPSSSTHTDIWHIDSLLSVSKYCIRNFMIFPGALTCYIRVNMVVCCTLHQIWVQIPSSPRQDTHSFFQIYVLWKSMFIPYVWSIFPWKHWIFAQGFFLSFSGSGASLQRPKEAVVDQTNWAVDQFYVFLYGLHWIIIYEWDMLCMDSTYLSSSIYIYVYIHVYTYI